MLGSIVLVLCLVAGAIAAGILFVLVGPVPVNRRVTMVSRIQAPLPTAAGPIATAGMSVFDPAQASFPPPHASFTPPQALPVAQPPAFGGHAMSLGTPGHGMAVGTPAPDERRAVAALDLPPLEPPRPAPRKAKPPAPIAPVNLRRPRTAPSPLPRVRSARGTEPRPNQFDVEHTAPEAPMFEVDDPTFLEDGHS